MKHIVDKDIIGEIHQTRERLAEKFKDDAGAFFADLMKRQTANGARLVSPLSPRRAGENQPTRS